MQSVNDDHIHRAQVLDLTDWMNSRLTSVTANGGQNNPLPPDLQFRGFTATPLHGGAEGIGGITHSFRCVELRVRLTRLLVLH
ncbi:MAG: hypothetical protein ABI304_14895 [Rudaea sp.]